jgi:hypothetical protein
MSRNQIGDSIFHNAYAFADSYDAVAGYMLDETTRTAGLQEKLA